MPPSHFHVLHPLPHMVELQLKALETRNSVASDLRESFNRLHLQHQQRELEYQTGSCDRTDEGREKPSATEASMSVR